MIDLLDEPWRVSSTPKGKQNVSMHFGIVFLATDSFPLITIKNCGDEEVSEVRWVPIEEVDSLECAFNHRAIIEEFLITFTESNGN